MYPSPSFKFKPQNPIVALKIVHSSDDSCGKSTHSDLDKRGKSHNLNQNFISPDISADLSDGVNEAEEGISKMINQVRLFSFDKNPIKSASGR